MGDRDAENAYDRRTVLKGMGAAGATATGVGAVGQPATSIPYDELYDHECDPDHTPPVIDTADHLESGWWGTVNTTSGNTERNYDISGGSIPTDTDELVVHVHGWYADRDCGIRDVIAARYGYSDASFDGAVTGLVWDSEHTWGAAKDMAEIQGTKLANFLTDYKADHPDVTLRLQGHSLGARVACETVLELDAQNECDALTSLILLAGAVNNDDVSTTGKYGDAIERAVEYAENFWMDENDDILDYVYRPRELSLAIGNDGCDGSGPSNYTDHEVSLDGHASYYRANVGIVDEIIANFEAEPTNGGGCSTNGGGDGGSDDGGDGGGGDDDDDCWLFCWW